MLKTLAALAGLLGGCAIPALQGIPEERRVALPDELLGEWREMDEEEPASPTFRVERGAGESCRAVVRFEDEEGAHELPLELTSIELAGQRILDVTLAADECEKLDDSYGALVIPTHVFCRLQGGGKRVTLTFLDPDWLNGRANVGHIDLYDDLPIVIAGSSDLIELLTAAVGDAAAWKDDWTLTRAP